MPQRGTLGQGYFAPSSTLTRDEILQKVLDGHNLAMERGQVAAALRALEILGAELHGMFKGRTQIDINARMRELSDDAVLDRNLALLGLPRTIADHSGDSDSAPSEAKSESQPEVVTRSGTRT